MPPAAIAGLCALLLLIPVILLSRVLGPAQLLQRAGPNVLIFSLWLYQLFGIAFSAFVYGFVSVGVKRGDGLLVTSAYVLSLSYLISVLIAVPVLFGTGQAVAALADMPLIVARGIFTCLFGSTMLRLRNHSDPLAWWVGIAALATGAGTLSQLLHAGWDDIASAAFLVTGTIQLVQNSLD
jgi:hypothetical protein